IRKMAGYDAWERPSLPVTIKDELHSDGRESYVRATVTRSAEGYTAVSTGSQGSHMMTSLVKANALVVIPEGVKVVRPGERLTALMIDWPETVF
ncbi:MAG: molybdopterin molybdenumtransferase MoeA, partial [Chloroflexi bacterium]|nr:molybdopterin molybdenumtransferase MoeA [Chloroflexota bacterium]